VKNNIQIQTLFYSQANNHELIDLLNNTEHDYEFLFDIEADISNCKITNDQLFQFG